MSVGAAVGVVILGLLAAVASLSEAWRVAAVCGALAIASMGLAVGGVAVTSARARRRAVATENNLRQLMRRDLPPLAATVAAVHTRLLEQDGRLRRALRAETFEIGALIHTLPTMGFTAPPPAAPSLWAMNPRGLAQVVSLIRSERSSLAIELGSGVSTVWLATALKEHGGRLVSVEHDERFAAVTRALVAQHGLDDVVDIRVAPLVEREEGTAWYDAQVFDDVTGIDLAIVDGPPAATGPDARAAAMDFLAARLAPRALVVADDVVRASERRMVADWLARHPELSQVELGYSSIAVLRWK